MKTHTHISNKMLTYMNLLVPAALTWMLYLLEMYFQTRHRKANTTGMEF